MPSNLTIVFDTSVSIMGLTIDYGPYAFMDIYDPLHICNHTDETGRYAYKVSSLPPPLGFDSKTFLDSINQL